MILFELNCHRDHNFEAWFKDGDTCDRQLKRKTLECPVCGSAKVAKALMAPRVGRKGNGGEIVAAAQPAQAEVLPPDKMAMMPAEIRKALKEIKQQIETNCDYVGDKFAEEARKIHYGETEARGIYGEATEDQHRDLVEDGIEVARIPWLPREDA
jgi:hypothetical protein